MNYWETVTSRGTKKGEKTHRLLPSSVQQSQTYTGSWAIKDLVFDMLGAPLRDQHAREGRRPRGAQHIPVIKDLAIAPHPRIPCQETTLLPRS